MKLDYKDHDAPRNELITFLKNITHSTEIYESDKANTLRLYQLWEPFLKKGTVKKDFFTPSFSLIEEFFPLEHNLFSNDIVMYFNISNLNMLIKHNIIPSSTIMLSQCIENLHFTQMNDTILKNEIFITPIIAVKMVSYDETKGLTFGEVVDGNHRVSAAIASRKDIPITTLDGMFIPSFAFRNETSWILYHLITGISVTAGNIVDSSEQEIYLQQLYSFLNHCFELH